MNTLLPIYEEETNLVEYVDGETTHRLHPEALDAWINLANAAGGARVSLHVVSAFRSKERQSEIIARKRAMGLSDEEIFRFSAPPGHSEHHTGRAIDINTSDCEPLEEDFENTKAFRWLQNNASDFGFRLSYPRDNEYGIGYEPWHWFFEG